MIDLICLLPDAGRWLAEKLSHNETPAEAMQRELQEEIGRSVRVTRWKVYMHGPYREGTVLVTQHVFTGMLDVPVSELVRGEGQALAFVPREQTATLNIAFGFDDLLAEYYTVFHSGRVQA